MKKILTGILFFGLAITGNVRAQQATLPAKPNEVRPLMIGDMVPSAIISDMEGQQLDIQKITGNKKRC